MRIYEKEEFLERYHELKSLGISEKEIAKRMIIPYDTLYYYKKDYGIPINSKWREERLMEKEKFIEKYSELKNKGLLEKEISNELGISKNTMYRYKKEYGLPMITPKTKELINHNGLSKEMLEIAKENGLDSSLVNARIREHQWSVEDACTIEALPIGSKMMKKGKRKDETI